MALAKDTSEPDRHHFTPPTPIAFLGTGSMGKAMAARLIAAGYPVNLWNRSADKLEPLALMGGIPCGTPAKAAHGVDIVCLCLTDAAAVASVVFGPDGAYESLRRQTVILDFSTIGPAATKAMAERAANHCGALWLDCPVSGGVVGAQSGTLSVFAGGDPMALDRVMPLLCSCAARVTHMGRVGAGQATKLCNQLIVATNLLAIAEALHVGETLGLDLLQLPLALQGGFADSRPLQVFGPRMAALIDPGATTGGLKMMYKDIDAIRVAAAGVPVPLLNRVAALYGTLMTAGLGGEDIPALMRIYRDGLVGKYSDDTH